jgi:gliding motility-associated-like protein
MLDSNDWRYVQWTYTANYDYEYIYVGYMGNPSTATINAWSNGGGVVYYIWMEDVRVIPVDSVEIVAMDDFELCEDSVAYLSATSNVEYQWAWDNGNNISSDQILEVSPLVTTTYYAFAGNYFDCVKMDSVTVTVIDCSCMIPIDIAYEVVNNTNCPLSQIGNGYAVVTPTNGIEPYFYQWNDPAMQQNDTASFLSGGIYTCVVTDSDSCTASVTITVSEGLIPDLNFNVSNESCVGSADGAIDLTVINGNAPYTYLWSNDSTTQDISGLSVGWYSVTVGDNLNCPFVDSAWVDYALPLEYQYPLICEGSPIVDLNFMGATNGTWVGPGIVDPIAGLFDPVASGVGQFDIQFVSNVSCSQDFSMLVVVDPLPNVNFTANAQAGCQPLDVSFSVENAGLGATYIWNFGDGNVSSQGPNVPFTYINYGLFDVALSIIDSNGCSDSKTIDQYIHVYETPVADFNFTPKQLDDVQSTAQFFSTSSAIATNWIWTFGDGSTSFEENPIHNYDGPGYYQVNLTASTTIGCSDIATNFIKYKDVIFMYVPTAFTPNNDGRNDVFQVEARGEINIFSLKIFDRWGELVFSTTDINEPWVGNMMNGDYYLTTAVFSFVLEYEAWGPQLEEPIGETITGTITLMK